MQRYVIAPVHELSDTSTVERAARRAGWTHRAQGMMLKAGCGVGAVTPEQLAAAARALIYYELGAAAYAHISTEQRRTAELRAEIVLRAIGLATPKESDSNG